MQPIFLSVLALLFLVPSTGPIPLPTEPSPVAVPSGTVFAPNKAPGNVDDQERVSVQSGFDGTPRSISVDQTLQLHGIGDYSLTIPANAISVSASAFQPSLRRGNIVWAGFSTGKRTLEATMSLDSLLELTRLPIAVKLTLPSESALEGNVNLNVHIQNASAELFTITDGNPDLPSLRSAIDAAKAALSMNRPPIAGANGVPAAIAGIAGPSQQVPVSTRIALHLMIHFSSGSFESNLRGKVSSIEASGVIDSTNPSFDLPIKGIAHHLSIGSVSVTATPELPRLDFNAPGPNESSAAIHNALHNFEKVVAAAARTNALNGYLGNPWTGSSHSSYQWDLLPQAHPAVRRKLHANALGIALSLLAFSCASGVGLVLRARS